MEITEEILKRASRIKLLAMDCDGVLTDGRLYYGESGERLKVFHVHDGQGIASWHAAGFMSAIVTARKSSMLDKRSNELGIRYLVQNAKDKRYEIEKICSENNISLEETAFIGDDIADITAMKWVGLPIAVSNAVPEIKAVAAFTTSKHGGEGAIREVVELLLSSRK